MNVKLHTPKTLRTGSGLSSVKQFLLSIIATTISIVITFGTAAIIDNHKKEAAKKQMVMMVISDFDKTIEILEKADTSLSESRRLQQELAIHPEHFDSLRYLFPQNLSFIETSFPETTEQIFSTSIETFNTIGNANFVNEVSSFYTARRKYKEEVIDKLRDDIHEHPVVQSLQSLMSVSFPEYVCDNWVFLRDMKRIRDKCMQMMHLSEKDLIKFNKQQKSEENTTENDALLLKKLKECDSCSSVIQQAREKLKD